MPALPQADLQVQPLAKHHDKNGFSCGVDSLDRYLKTQAGQDMQRKANGVFILTALAEPSRIIGYYTLCATSISQGDVPDEARKHIPRYPLVSATLIGRLAISAARQGEGLGEILLTDALQRAFENTGTVGSSMVIVDALDERAARFYATHRFVRFNDTMRLILPMRLAGGG
jgi:predicted GNAT family N-acyltransferase